MLGGRGGKEACLVLAEGHVGCDIRGDTTGSTFTIFDVEVTKLSRNVRLARVEL